MKYIFVFLIFAFFTCPQDAYKKNYHDIIWCFKPINNKFHDVTNANIWFADNIFITDILDKVFDIYDPFYPYNITTSNSTNCNLEISFNRLYKLARVSKNAIQINIKFVKHFRTIKKNRYLYVGLFTHQIGHFLGLKDLNDKNDVMYKKFIYQKIKKRYDPYMLQKMLSVKNMRKLCKKFKLNQHILSKKWCYNSVKDKYIYIGKNRCYLWIIKIQKGLHLC
ncbi:ORF MSV175 putative metalloprotease, similar to Bacteroides fragilis GB:U90931 [Melanoplus sanguinipes entomopoxvirus]|uniref:ORF MSV175 putative metalloprotease, similar to Bacteroides fragilis GB:U90931 n=1 Tax=Melanoplus sanguinipes entomopoxvirus TaxID=83191 RepID=Q9YVR8_MSEPV|nr:ORF MSV175 putative metalloprotease, similar to Bacteroides fragilis GB:U90931 [Melanoplus sanguinipes entomopoxvirus]AAC97774.1 ORF MSV175 putative metalloprotease, similar to Bacteroides fragilis GB:U90931 [Melanoplus sanguinipes entomopoxvirus 'O']